MMPVPVPADLRPAAGARARFAIPQRVLIVDDSLVIRSVIEHIVLHDPSFVLAGSFSNATNAIGFLKTNSVDIILLDIEMPGRSGLDALPDILAEAKAAPVMILSSCVADGAPMILKALSLGASDTLAKPGRNNYSKIFCNLLMTRMTALCTPAPVPAVCLAPQTRATPGLKTRSSKLSCLAIGGSTGALPGLYEILQTLDERITAPILITQHLPDSFMPFFVDQLASKVRRPVYLGRHGMPIQSGCIYVAPGNAHLACRNVAGQMQVDLMKIWQNTYHRPAVDPMLASVSRYYGAGAAAIILSGMGKDGLIGAGHFADQGAPVYVQDAATSVVWGMPGCIAQAGLASAMLSPSQISSFIADCWLETS